MIISASRRTDIPAFYSKWFIKRIRAGYCIVPNPFDTNQICYVSLCPEDVEIIVFWTRHPLGLLSYLKELTQRGYRYYFLFTIMDNPLLIETKTPPLPSALKVFRRLSEFVGPEKVIWRYDPIVLSNVTNEQFHIKTFKHIADALHGYTQRIIMSMVSIYPKTRRRLQALEIQTINVSPGLEPSQAFKDLM